MKTKPKRKKPFSANNASRKKLEAEGWTVGLVEQRIPHCFITKDLWGFADLACCAVGRGNLMVQATGGGNLNARAAKIRTEARAGIWLAANPFNRIQVHDWRKRAGQKERECVILEITAQK
jgi:hypothetical protein